MLSTKRVWRAFAVRHPKIFAFNTTLHHFATTAKPTIKDFDNKPALNLTVERIVRNRSNKPLIYWQRQGVVNPVPTELLLLQELLSLFPNSKPLYKAKTLANIKNPMTGRFFEVDICYLDLNLYIEFQDPHHYRSTWFNHKPLQEIQETDALKKRIVTDQGGTMIQIPCWWDGKKESLAATIKTVRPDLLPDIEVSCDPIPGQEPLNTFKSNTVSNVGELMAPSIKQLEKIDFTRKWWLQEKYDGFRCCWDPIKRVFFSRGGYPISIPDVFKDYMPNEYLDGELWFGYGTFEEVTKLNPQNNVRDIDWTSLKFVVFDVPNPDYIAKRVSYEQRYERLLKVVTPSHPFLVPISSVRISEDQQTNQDLVRQFVSDITQQGGEGLVLSQAGLPYTPGRSNCSVKIKVMRDEDALVIDIRNDVYDLEMPCGTRFTAPIPRANEFGGPIPKLHDVVSYQFRHLIRGNLPADPHIYRVRADLSWEEVKSNQGGRYHLSGHKDYTRKWTGDKDDVCKHLLQLAKDMEFDSQDPINWYRDDVLKTLQGTLGAINMIKIHFGGNVVKAIMASFPDIGLDLFKFRYPQKNLLEDTATFRELLLQVAKERGFDPFVADNWYRFPFYSLRRRQALMGSAKIPLPTRIATALPEVKFDHGKFKTPNELYLPPAEFRDCMLRLAARGGFDPLIPMNWYNLPFNCDVSSKAICQHKNFPYKLAKAFPDVKFDITQFRFPVFDLLWEERRAIFMDFAKQFGFDPLVAANWYSIPVRTFRNFKKARFIIDTYKSYGSALRDIFPEVSFDPASFRKRPS